MWTVGDSGQRKTLYLTASRQEPSRNQKPDAVENYNGFKITEKCGSRSPKPLKSKKAVPQIRNPSDTCVFVVANVGVARGSKEVYPRS